MNDGMTNKELMLQMFELQKSTAVQMQEIKSEMKFLREKVTEHDEALRKLSHVPDNIGDIKETLQKLEKKSEEGDSAIEKRLTGLEGKSAKNALEIWKKIGSGFLGALITALFALIWSKFIK